jgi:hypothetical protein
MRSSWEEHHSLGLNREVQSWHSDGYGQSKTAIRVPSRSTKEMETSARQRSGPESSPQQADNEATTEEIRTRIEKLAYELYQQRGRQDGYDRQDWLEAERLTLDGTDARAPRQN